MNPRIQPACLPPANGQVCGADDTPYPDDPNWSPTFDGVTVRKPACQPQQLDSCTLAAQQERANAQQLGRAAVAPCCPLFYLARRTCQPAAHWHRQPASCRPWRSHAGLPPRWLAGRRCTPVCASMCIACKLGHWCCTVACHAPPGCAYSKASTPIPLQCASLRDLTNRMLYWRTPLTARWQGVNVTAVAAADGPLILPLFEGWQDAWDDVTGKARSGEAFPRRLLQPAP